MGKTILIAEDDEGYRVVLDMMLSVDGYDVVLTQDGREALSWLRGNTPDLAILDVAMPHMDGIEVCERMKNVPRLANVPVLILTALRDERTIELARLVKADALVPKPLEGKDFRDIVRQIMAGVKIPF